MARISKYLSVFALVGVTMLIATTSHATVHRTRESTSVNVSTVSDLYVSNYAIVYTDHFGYASVSITYTGFGNVGVLPDSPYRLPDLVKYPRPVNDPKPDNIKVKENQRWQNAYLNIVENKL